MPDLVANGVEASALRPDVVGGKRKRESKPAKFYAVRVGKIPGIYHTWAECFEQVRGHPNAAFRSFASRSDAESFVSEGTAPAGGSASQKWYGVQAGRNPGVYTSWQDVLDQITGWKGARQKAFKSRTEAEQFVAEVSQAGITAVDRPSVKPEAVEPPAKKAKASKSRKSLGGKDEDTPAVLVEQGELEPGEGPLNTDMEDGFDPAIVLDPTTQQLRYRTREERETLTYRASGPAENAPIRIYTDGSSLGNGRDIAIAGVGVYFGPGDRRNVSEPLSGARQTNQRAELTAILRALEIAPRDRRIVIVSDSKYAIDCSTDWFRNWQRNGWVNASRKPVENRDLVQKIIDLLEERQRVNRHRAAETELNAHGSITDPRAYWDRGPGGVMFEWVKGHDKDESNAAADRLAVGGSLMAQELNKEVDIDE